MGRRVRDYALDTPEARSKRSKRNNPYWRGIIPGLHIGYRKGKRGGVWYGRKYMDDGKYQKWRLGTADDIVDSDGVEVLTFAEADEKVRLGPFGSIGKKMDTVNDLMAYYIKGQQSTAQNAKTTQYAIDKYITPTIGTKKLSRLTADSLREWLGKLAEPRKGVKKKSSDSPREQRRKRQASYLIDSPSFYTGCIAATAGSCSTMQCQS